MIYLDYNATAPIRPEVKNWLSSLINSELAQALNPSSIHSKGREARSYLEARRSEILKAVNGKELVFCASATEANNLALHQAAGKTVVISAIEHESIYKTPDKIEVRVNMDGVIDLGHFEEILSSKYYPLCSIMLANNETGVIQPVQEAAKIASKYNTLIHCDAVQGFGKIEIDFAEIDVDMMTISSHKIGGIIGAAALVYKPGLQIKPQFFGGSQEKKQRAGTENLFAITGMALAAKNVSRETLAAENEKLTKLKTYLENEIKTIAPDSIIYGENSPRLANTSCISMPGMPSSTQLIHFDTNGICVSAGSACSSGKVEVSRVLKAMGVEMAANAIRVSTGWATMQKEIDVFIEKWKELYFRK